MPRTPEANQFVKEKRKKEILLAALKLFCLQGYEHVTMDRISKEAKISHGLIYHYFSKKTEILSELISESRQKFNQIFNLDHIKTLKGTEFFQNFTEFIISAVSLGGEYSYYIALYLNFKISPTLYEDFGSTSYFKELENNFKVAQSEGKFEKGSPKEYLICYFFLLKSITMSAIYSNNKNTIPSAEVILNLFKRSI